jgi:hypothetical protein
MEKQTPFFKPTTAKRQEIKVASNIQKQSKRLVYFLVSTMILLLGMAIAYFVVNKNAPKVIIQTQTQQ